MSITISLTAATATTNSVVISLTQSSGCFILADTQGLAFDGTFTFNSLSITQTEVNFGVSPGASFDGTITLDVQPSQPNGAPTLLISNLDIDSAVVTYPTNDGLETQMLTPGQELTLSGFIVD